MSLDVSCHYCTVYKCNDVCSWLQWCLVSLNINTELLHRLGRCRNAESAKFLKVIFLFPSRPVLPCTCPPLCVSSVNVSLNCEISTSQMLNHPWQVAFFIERYRPVGSLLAILWRTARLDISQNSSWHQTDTVPTHHNVADNRQWSRSRICKGIWPQRGQAALVWSVPFSHVRMFVSRLFHTAQSMWSTPVLCLIQQHQARDLLEA